MIMCNGIYYQTRRMHVDFGMHVDFEMQELGKKQKFYCCSSNQHRDLRRQRIAERASEKDKQHLIQLMV